MEEPTLSVQNVYMYTKWRVHTVFTNLSYTPFFAIINCGCTFYQMCMTLHAREDLVSELVVWAQSTKWSYQGWTGHCTAHLLSRGLFLEVVIFSGVFTVPSQPCFLFLRSPSLLKSALEKKQGNVIMSLTHLWVEVNQFHFSSRKRSINRKNGTSSLNDNLLISSEACFLP